MESYEVIQPPFSLDFKNMKKKERDNYYKWYMDIFSGRLDLLIHYVKNSFECDNWKADYSPESLVLLGQWFYDMVEVRDRSKQEIEGIHSHSPEWFNNVEVNSWELTNKTFSIAFDIGLYLAKVFLSNNPTLRWDHHNAGRKDHINFGQPVISGFNHGMEFNPTHIVITIAYGIADQNGNSNELKEVYETWLEMYM